MKISGIQENGGRQRVNPGVSMSEDSVSKSLRKQIGDKQKQIQEISSQEKLTMEEKMKKRQDLQKEINDLNNQLRQHEIEVRKEKQSKKTSMNELLGETGDKKAAGAGKQNKGFSQAGMQAMISADSAMKQAKVQGGVAADLTGKGRVLDIEIRLDGARGGSTKAKQEELAKIQQRAKQAEESQMSALAEANKVAEAGTEEKTAEKPEKAENSDKTENPDKTNKTQRAGKQEENVAAQGIAEAESQQAVTYHSVDIYL